MGGGGSDAAAGACDDQDGGVISGHSGWFTLSRYQVASAGLLS
jgi:hypothetical protein